MAQAILDASTRYKGFVSLASAPTGEAHKLELPPILSTSYPLNNSGTKIATVGLQIKHHGRFEPVVQFTSSSSTTSIALNRAEWTALQANMPLIRGYFATAPTSWGSSKRLQESINIGNHDILFNMVYGGKAITFERCRVRSAPEPTYEREDDDTASEPRRKKSNRSASSITMQKPSLDGLFNLIVCIDERFRRLQRYTEAMYSCTRELISAVYTGMSENGLDDKITSASVKNFIMVNLKKVKDITRFGSRDPVFVEHFFDIAFAELIAMYIPFLMVEIVKEQQKILGKDIVPGVG